jgi:outer membrane protein assembly factor BamB
MSEHSHEEVNRDFSSGHVTVLLLVLCCIGLAFLSTPAQGWMFHADPTHSGVYDDGGIRPNNILRWSYTTGAQVWSSPTVANGFVYVGSEDYKVYALNAATGAHIWNFTTGNYVESSPAVANGIVYVGSNSSKVYALDAASGAQIWNYTTGDGVYSSPTVANGVVYVGCNNGKVYALTATTGAPIGGSWPVATAGPVISIPAVANGVVYVGSHDKKVYAFNATTGASIIGWPYSTGGAVWSSPAVANNVVFVGSNDYKVYALNATTKAHIWNYTTGYWVRSSPAVANNVVFVGSNSKKIYALNATTGAHIWNFTTGDIVYSSPAVANGVVYVGSDDNKVYALDATNNGAILWNYTTGGKVDSSPSVANGVVYIGCSDGKIYAIGYTPPTISGISPNTKTAGDPSFTLTITGTNFTTLSEVHWNSATGSILARLSLTATQIQVTVPAANIATAGAYEVYVVHSAPGGGSDHATLTVNNPKPTITNLNPNNEVIGTHAADYPVIVTGSGFVAGCTTTLAGNGRLVTFNSANQVTVAFLAVDDDIAGTFAVVITNPGPFVSDPFNYVVINTTSPPIPPIPVPVPEPTGSGGPGHGSTLSGILPQSGVTGTTVQTTITGTNFQGTTVTGKKTATQITVWLSSQVNEDTIMGQKVTVQSPTTLTCNFDLTGANPGPWSLELSRGSGWITFVLPDAFTVKFTLVLPVINHITPSTVKAGTKAFILTVTGEHFAKGNRVLWKGVARETTFVSATTIRAKVLANDIAKAGKYVVSVYRPGRNAATSNGVAVNVRK